MVTIRKSVSLYPVHSDQFGLAIVYTELINYLYLYMSQRSLGGLKKVAITVYL